MADPIDVAALVSEVADSNFDDERLNLRLKALVAGLSEDPCLSLPRSFDSAGLEGAYRFFSNPRVTPDDILAGHFEATRKRCQDEGDFLVAHDSTSFSYRYDGEREGLGRAQRSNPRSNQMFLAHVSLAISADETHRPLGIVGFTTWTRGPTKSGVEYQRWENQIRVAANRLGGHQNAIHLADREADDYEMFAGLARDGVRFVIRCLYNRCLEETSGDVKLHELFAKIPPIAERQVALHRRKPRREASNRKIHPARNARSAKLCVAAATVALKRPQTRRAHSTHPPASVTINVVRVWEPDPPGGVAPVEWFLYTTEPIETPEQQLAIVDHYRARWRIEEYFKAIKTGCDFESRQLQDYEALINLLATFAPIAYRMLLLRSEVARDPDQPAIAILSSDHLDVLRARGRLRLPPEPTAREVFLAIAALGGHIKYSGDPGWLTLARGYEKLETLTEGWCAAKLQLRSDQG